MKKRTRYKTVIIVILLFVMLFVSACQKPEQTLKESNTDIKEILLPISFSSQEEQMANTRIFWLYDEVVLLIRETDSGCSYNIFDWNEEKLLKSGELSLARPPIKSQGEQVSWVQLSQNLFLVKNLFEASEVYIWEYRNGETVVQKLLLEETLIDFAVNENGTLLAGISANRELLQIFQMQQETGQQMSLEISLTMGDLTVPPSSKLVQVAFVNDEELVYSWNQELDSTKSGYGVYSIANQAVVSQNMFGSSEMRIGSHSVLVLKGVDVNRTSVEFAFIHASGESVIVKNNTIAFQISALRNGFASGEYVGFISFVEHQSPLCWTLLKPLDEGFALDWFINFGKINPSALFWATKPTLALTEDEEPLLVFCSAAYSSGYRQGTTPDVLALFVVTRKQNVALNEINPFNKCSQKSRKLFDRCPESPYHYYAYNNRIQGLELKKPNQIIVDLWQATLK